MLSNAPRALTPHPGEFRRLASDEKLSPDEWSDRAVELAEKGGVVLVLKTHQTLVTDGRRRWLNSTGNPGMATGGAGDVLTGLIASFFAQGMPPFEAAQLAVHTHGLAGDLAAAELGQAGMIASDLVRFLPLALRRAEENSLSAVSQ